MARPKGSKNKTTLIKKVVIPAPKKRGRPKKAISVETPAVLKKRGRPKKIISVIKPTSSMTGKKRGRPTKIASAIGVISKSKNPPTIEEKLISVGDSKLLFRRHVWKNVPIDLIVDELTPAGSRLVYAEEPEVRYFLKHFIPAGAHNPDNGLPCPNGGVSVTCRQSDYIHTLPPEGVMIHSSKQIREELPKEARYYTGGHREGTVAAEKAANKELKRQAKQQKLDEKQAKHQAKIDAKNSKIEAKKAKKQARLDKKVAKEFKKQQRLAKREAKRIKGLKQAKISGTFLKEEKKKQRKKKTK